MTTELHEGLCRNDLPGNHEVFGGDYVRWYVIEFWVNNTPKYSTKDPSVKQP